MGARLLLLNGARSIAFPLPVNQGDIESKRKRKRTIRNQWGTVYLYYFHLFHQLPLHCHCVLIASHSIFIDFNCIVIGLRGRGGKWNYILDPFRWSHLIGLWELVSVWKLQLFRIVMEYISEIEIAFELAYEIVCRMASSPIAQIKHVEVDQYSEPCIGCVNQSTVIEQSIQIWLGKATEQYTYPLHSKVKSSRACGININLFWNIRLRNINLSWMAMTRLPDILTPSKAIWMIKKKKILQVLTTKKCLKTFNMIKTHNYE